MTATWICCAMLAAVAALTRTTFASLQLAFPINSQVPPVAYVSKKYEFVFAPTTFENDGSDIAYTLVGSPTWLQLESASRRLSGIPSADDTGAPTFSLVATDRTGQKAASVTLVVLQETAITVQADILSQLQTQGNATSPASLLYHPLQIFSFSFSHGTFIGTLSETSYYATSRDGSPLPSWIQFDSAKLHFSGNAPPLLQPPPAQQQYDISLAASNVVGFSEASVSFSILIGNHLLGFNPPSISIGVPAGSILRIPPLLPSLVLDGRTVTRGNLSSITSTAPGWLVLNTADISLIGAPPDSADGGTFYITAKSDSSNAANVTVTYKILSRSAANQIDLGSFDAPLDTSINYQIQIPSGLNLTHEVSVALGDLASWLSFTSSNLTLNGVVPASTQLAQYSISVLFKEAFGGTIAGNLTVNIVANDSSIPSDTVASSTSSATAPDGTAGAIGAYRSKLNTTKLVLAVIVPVVGVLVLICLGLAFLQLRARRKENTQTFTGTNMSSPPSAQVLLVGSRETLPPPILSRPQTSHSNRHDGPPRLELPWAPDSIQGARKRLSKRPKTSHSSEIGASWDDLIGRPAPSVRSPQASYLPPALRISAPIIDYSRPLPRASPTVRKKKSGRLDRKLARDTFQSRVSKVPRMSAGHAIGLPKRASGAGHGTMIVNTSFDPQRSSWQTTFGAILQLESRPNTVLLESFPSPPSNSTFSKRDQVDVEPKLTLRVVSPEGNYYEGDTQAARQKHTQKARDKLEGAIQSSKSADGTATVDASRAIAPDVEPMLTPSPPTRIRPTLFIYPPADINHLNAPVGLSLRQLTPNSLSNYSRSPGTSPVMSSGALGSLTHPPPSPFQPTPPSPNAQQHRNPTSTSFSKSLHRLTSTASSRQFDSAASSDSQWEDEEPVPDEADHRAMPSASQRLPPQPVSPSQQSQHNPRQPQYNQEDRRPSSTSFVLHQHQQHQDPRCHPKYQSLTLPPHNLTFPSSSGPLPPHSPPTTIAPLFFRPNFTFNSSYYTTTANNHVPNTMITPASPTTAVNMGHASATMRAAAGFEIFEDAPDQDEEDENSLEERQGRVGENDSSRSLSLSRRKRVVTGGPTTAGFETGGGVGIGDGSSDDDDDERGSYRFL